MYEKIESYLKNADKGFEGFGGFCEKWFVRILMVICTPIAIVAAFPGYLLYRLRTRIKLDKASKGDKI